MSNIKYEEMNFDDAQNEIDFVERPEDVLLVLKSFHKNTNNAWEHSGYIIIYQTGEMQILNEEQCCNVDVIDIVRLTSIYKENVKRMANLYKSVEIIPIHNHPYDMTFLVEQIRVNDNLIQEEVIGWYHGEPNDENTKLYSTKYRGKYIAKYMTEEEALTDF